MLLFFLQVKTVTTATDTLLNYGAMGAVLVLCIIALVAQTRASQKQWQKQEARHFLEIDTLRTQLNTYVQEDRKAANVVMNNANAMMDKVADALRELTRAIHDK